MWWLWLTGHAIGVNGFLETFRDNRLGKALECRFGLTEACMRDIGSIIRLMVVVV